MSRISLIMIYNFLPPVAGGIEAHVHNLLKHLDGHCTVYYIGLKASRTAPRYEKHGSIEYQRLQWDRFTMIRRIVAALGTAKKGIHLIHGHTLGDCGMSAILLGKLLRKPVVITVHESSFIKDVSSRNTMANVKYRFVLREAKRIITTSDELRRYVLRLNGQMTKVKEIPNGVDLTLFNPSVDGSGTRRDYHLDGLKVVLCPRRIDPKNGVLYLVEAMPKVLEKMKNVRFLFVGPISDHDYWRVVERRLENLEVKDYAIFTGSIPHDEMPRYYAAADVVVIPSLIEAVSLAALEAMACGKPIVASAVGGLLEIVQDHYNGMLIKPKDHEGMAKAILTLLQNAGICSDYGVKGYHTAQNLSWDYVASQVMKVYEHCFE